MTIAQKKHFALLLVFAAFAVNITAVAKNFNSYNNAGSGYALNRNTHAAKPYVAPVLSNLSANTGALSPAFNEAITGYRVNLPYATNSIKITPTTTEPGATITVNEIDVASGTASPSIILSVGINTIPVAITTADGLNTNTYTVTVVRAGQAPNLSYPANTYVFNKGDNITPVVPTVTGGAVPAVAYATTSTLNLSGGATSFQYNQFRATGICADLQGNLYIAIKNAIWKITPSGVVTLLVGQATAGYADGTGGAVKFNNPVGIALDAAGNLYVGDAGNNRIRKVTPDGVVSTFAGSGTAGASNGTGAAASFRSPHGLAMDNAGNLFVADNGNNLIRKITPLGVTTTFAGSVAEGSTNGTGTSASFDGPSAIAADRQGNLYVVCINAAGLRKITSAAVVSNIPVGFGVLGVTADAIGSIYLTCGENNSKLYKMPSGGTFEFLAGGSSIDPVRQPRRADGVGSGAAFSMPSGIVADNLGNIYITDAGTDRIRKVTVTGFTLSPAIDGLVFDGTTGTLSGTASFLLPATNYTVSGINAAGMDTSHLNITVRSVTPELSALQVSAGTLSPAFVPGVANYTVAVQNNISSINVTPSVSNSFGIKVNGVAVASGAASAGIALNTGVNTINVVVSDAGSTTKTYTIQVTRAYGAESRLSNLNIDESTLSPAFLSSVTSYNGVLPSTVSTLHIRPTLIDSKAIVSVGDSVLSTAGVINYPVVTGANMITVKVVSENGDIVTKYRLNLRKQDSATATLDKLTLIEPSVARINTSSGAGDYNSTATVSASTTSIKVVPVATDAASTISVNGVITANGVSSAPIAISADTTLITVQVTATNNVAIKNYVIKVIRQQPYIPGILSQLYLLDPLVEKVSLPTGPADYNSIASVPRWLNTIRVMAVAHYPGAIVKINGVVTASGTASAPITLGIDSTLIMVEVTGTNSIKTYSIKIAREDVSSIAMLKRLYLVEPAVAKTSLPNYERADFNSEANVLNSSKTIRVIAEAIDTSATIRINGVITRSGERSLPINLNVGPNVIYIIVTAQNGVNTRSWGILVTRAAAPAMFAANSHDNKIGIVEKPEAAVGATPEGLVVKQAVSPNGDGINDRLVIEGITAYPENTVKIMDRDGSLIYEAKGYDNQGQAFDGRSSKGVRQRAGTYFYSIEYKKGDEVKRAAGYLVIKY